MSGGAGIRTLEEVLPPTAFRVPRTRPDYATPPVAYFVFRTSYYDLLQSCAEHSARLALVKVPSTRYQVRRLAKRASLGGGRGI